MRLEEIGLIGNGQFAAHVACNGSVVWCCMPRGDRARDTRDEALQAYPHVGLIHGAFVASRAWKDVL